VFLFEGGWQKTPLQGKFHEIAKQFLAIFRPIPKLGNFQQFLMQKREKNFSEGFCPFTLLF
jgi:hypothetical protein